MNQKVSKCLRIGCSILSSVMMLSSAWNPTFAEAAVESNRITKETIASSAQFGDLKVFIDGDNTTIPSDSTLEVQFIEDDDLDFQASEFDDLFVKIDNSMKGQAEKVGIYRLQLKDSLENKITNFNGKISVYLEVPKSFDAKETEVCYIKNGQDEQFEEKVVTIDGKNFINFETDHFSPYALIDKETKGSFYSILGISIFGTVLIAGIVAYIMYKRKNSTTTA